MGDLIELDKYRDRMVDQRCFGPWNRRFGESFGWRTTLPDLSARTLFALAVPGDASTAAFYELIMGCRELGTPADFHFLDNDQRMEVVDIHLFLADQIRFELMYRLGWIERFAGRECRLVEMVVDYTAAKSRSQRQPPQLARSHPDYEAYRTLVFGDQQAFLRRLIPKALESFQHKL